MGENGLSSTTWAIEAYSLAKSFGNIRALAGIDLKVRKGDHLTIFGPNGAGKTTLIKLLSTLTKPSGGSVLLDGLDIREAPGQIRSRLGVVSHSTFLYNKFFRFSSRSTSFLPVQFMTVHNSPLPLPGCIFVTFTCLT